MSTCTHHSKQDTQTYVSDAADSVPFDTYENICCSRGTADSRYSAPNVQDEPDINSAIYTNLLPPTTFEVASGVCLGKKTHKKHKKTAANRHATSKHEWCISFSLQILQWFQGREALVTLVWFGFIRNSVSYCKRCNCSFAYPELCAVVEMPTFPGGTILGGGGIWGLKGTDTLPLHYSHRFF